VVEQVGGVGRAHEEVNMGGDARAHEVDGHAAEGGEARACGEEEVVVLLGVLGEEEAFPVGPGEADLVAGTEIGLPVLKTFAPRTRPSVVSIEMARTW
jgi:hypothetical protein